MEFITGRIVIVGNKEVINTENGSFLSVILVIKKRMNKKLRNIAFKCYGKLAEKVDEFRVNDKVEVEYFIQSNQNKKTGRWHTDLQAKSVEKIVIQKENESQLKINQDVTGNN